MAKSISTKTTAVTITGEPSVHADQPTREPHWSPRRVKLVEAMRKLGAKSETSAVLAEDIAKAMGTVDGVKMIDRVDLVKIILDVYRTAELIHNGFAASSKHEGDRVLRYYLTKKGMATKFPVKIKEAKEE